MLECLDLEVLFYVRIVLSEVERMLRAKVDFLLFILNDSAMLHTMRLSLAGRSVRSDLGC